MWFNPANEHPAGTHASHRIAAAHVDVAVYVNELALFCHDL
jgi:hypothetical protein